MWQKPRQIDRLSLRGNPGTNSRGLVQPSPIHPFRPLSSAPSSIGTTQLISPYGCAWYCPLKSSSPSTVAMYTVVTEQKRVASVGGETRERR